MANRHTKGAPAGIQRQLQRMFIPAYEMPAGTTTPTAATSGVNRVWSFNEALWQDVLLAIPVPLDWVAGTVVWVYPVFSMDVNLFAQVRWGLEYVPHVKGISVAAIGSFIEGTFDADGTGTVIPPKSQWLTLRGDLVAGGEPAFQRDDFTGLVHIACRLYRDGASELDNHPGAALLYGLAVVYEAFI